MSKKRYIKNGELNAWDYVFFEEYPEEYGKRIYIDVYNLACAAEDQIRNNKRYKNFEVELSGVKRWEH